MPGSQPTGASALAVAGGKVLAVGADAQVRALAGPDTRLTDLRGATVLPGFVDTHLHLDKIAHELAMVDFAGTRTLAEACERLRVAAAEREPGEVVEVFGADPTWHESQWPERRLPTRAELDRVAPRNPVAVRRAPDTLVLSSGAVERVHSRLDASGAWDPVAGRFSGAGVKALVEALGPPPLERRVAELAAASPRLAAAGITAVIDPGRPGGFADSWQLYELALGRGVLLQRVALMNRLRPGEGGAAAVARVERSAALPGTPGARLAAGALKVLLDGEIADAWMRPGEQGGAAGAKVHYEHDDLAFLVDAAVAHGWPICVHAVGGAALDETLAAFDGGAGGHDLPLGTLSVAHALFPTAANVEAATRLGVVLAVQPALFASYGELMVDAWGPAAERAMPLRTLLDTGVATAGGSDVLPFEPLAGMVAAVSRRVASGRVLGAGEAVTPDEALALFTSAAAPYAAAQGLRGVGVLAEGAHADFTVWVEPPLGGAPESWSDRRPDLVVIGGAPVRPTGRIPDAL